MFAVFKEKNALELQSAETSDFCENALAILIKNTVLGREYLRLIHIIAHEDRCQLTTLRRLCEYSLCK